MEITETVSRQIYIFHYALIQMEVTDNCLQLIFKVQTIQKCQHCQLSIYYGELDYSCMGIDGPYKWSDPAITVFHGTKVILRPRIVTLKWRIQKSCPLQFHYHEDSGKMFPNY